MKISAKKTYPPSLDASQRATAGETIEKGAELEIEGEVAFKSTSPVGTNIKVLSTKDRVDRLLSIPNRARNRVK